MDWLRRAILILFLVESNYGLVAPVLFSGRRRNLRIEQKVIEKKEEVVSSRPRRAEVSEIRKRNTDYEDSVVSEWTKIWDESTNQTRSGFDWEMEKLRRRLEANIPEALGGPKYWRSYIEEKPESAYRRWAGSTYPGAKPGSLDAFRILLNNILQFVLGNESEDGARVASWDWQLALKEKGIFVFIKAVISGDLQTLVGGPLFLLLTKYHLELGPVFKLAFGPRSFIVVADPAIARHILRDKSENFDKGLLGEILKPILGNGLIPADPDIWKRRRRIIVPGFHRAWLDQTLSIFHDCTHVLLDQLESVCLEKDQNNNHYNKFQYWKDWKDGIKQIPSGVVDLEERLCSTSLDIIGRAVFDYDFNSTIEESPLVRAVYRCLAEAEKRTTALFPIWLLPLADQWIPSLRAFRHDLDLLNNKLDELILQAQQRVIDQEEINFEILPDGITTRVSLLEFLVTMRGEDATNTQVRDDLMTMLVAGHETTAALLTWTLYELYHPSGRSAHLLERARIEVDAMFNAKTDTQMNYEDVRACEFTRLCLAEGLRLYPQPPLLIRRALDTDELPRPSNDYPAVKLSRGTDVFLSTWSLHKSPALWDDPESYDPTRFLKSRPPTPDSPAGWAGFNPDLIPDTALYPNEQSADYAFLPFGAGGRRCLGDQFAMLESTVLLASLIRNFDFHFAIGPDEILQPKKALGDLPVADIGMRTGATIHTEFGFYVTVSKRKQS
mmetsp:Transcript_19381/g.29439  ORF Transcript_19381/g.29439 Transcript_19381/m.29439 type:complete len:725 (-) Transcript_19381:117-2291(-)